MAASVIQYPTAVLQRQPVLNRLNTLYRGLTHAYIHGPFNPSSAVRNLAGKGILAPFTTATAAALTRHQLGGYSPTHVDATADFYGFDIGEELVPPISIAVWAQPTFAFTNSSTPGLIGNLDGSGLEGLLIFYRSFSDEWQFSVARSGGEGIVAGVVTSDAELGRNVMQLFVARADFVHGQSFHMNGGEVAAIDTNVTAHLTGGRTTHVGSNNDFGGTAGKWEGFVGPAFIWNRWISDAEVESLWNPATRWDLIDPPRAVIAKALAAPPPTSNSAAIMMGL